MSQSRGRRRGRVRVLWQGPRLATTAPLPRGDGSLNGRPARAAADSLALLPPSRRG